MTFSYREVMVLATSGLTGDGVVEGIDWVAQSIVRNVHVRQGGRIHDWCSAHLRRPCIYHKYFGSGSRHFLLIPDHARIPDPDKVFYEKFFYWYTIEFFFVKNRNIGFLKSVQRTFKFLKNRKLFKHEIYAFFSFFVWKILACQVPSFGSGFLIWIRIYWPN